MKCHERKCHHNGITPQKNKNLQEYIYTNTQIKGKQKEKKTYPCPDVAVLNETQDDQIKIQSIIF